MKSFDFVKPLLFAVPPETAHRLTVTALKLLPSGRPQSFDLSLAIEIAGLRFPSPIGLAAGFDKDAEVPGSILGLGFGFVEVGTLTPEPQPGNPRPRLFRLASDRAVINRMGFNNGGIAAALKRIRRNRPQGMLGINIGANKNSTDKVLDYLNAFEAAAPLADYVTVNISSPNTPGLRALQDKGALEELLDAVLGLRTAPGYGVPVFLKVAPDLEPGDIDDISEVALRRGVDALIVSNTTISRPPLASPYAKEAGGLSGAPLRDLAQQRLIDFRNACGTAIPLIGVGGIACAEDAYARIRAGASLIQLYSALVYEGPWLARRIADRLAILLKRDGFASLKDAVGIDA